MRSERESRTVLDRADELVKTGNYTGAIDLLCEANRTGRHADFERQLIDLRVRGFSQLDRPDPTCP